MAGDWIKIECATPDKPEVVAMAAELGIDQDCVVGKLLRLWIWADSNSVTGNALSVTFAFVDRYTYCPGFGEALKNVGWFAGSDGQLSFPNFDRHNGESAKKRCLGRNRAAKARNARNAASVTKALPEIEIENRLQSNINGNPSKLPIDGEHAISIVGVSEIPPDFIRTIYDEKKATRFADGNGNTIADWNLYIRARWKKHNKPAGAGKKSKPETPWSIKARIEEIDQQLENASGRDDFYDVKGCRLDSDPMNEKGRAHVAGLRKQRAKLKRQLSGVE